MRLYVLSLFVGVGFVFVGGIFALWGLSLVGNEKVMMQTFRPNAQGVLAITSRSYLVGGDLVMTESDEHKSGRLDTIAVYRSGSDDMEVFARQSDGSVKPVSMETLQRYKKQQAEISDYWKKAFDDKK